jgi:hypothetical protein
VGISARKSRKDCYIMGSSTHSIEVNAPLSAVYNQWTQFEEFPHFMEGVEEVRRAPIDHSPFTPDLSACHSGGLSKRRSEVGEGRKKRETFNRIMRKNEYTS